MCIRYYPLYKKLPTGCKISTKNEYVNITGHSFLDSDDTAPTIPASHGESSVPEKKANA